jgi:uncharacterized phage protein gp47/JayE
VSLPSRADLFAIGRRSLTISPTPRINPSVVDIPGSDLNLVVGSQSLMGEEIVARLAVCMLGLWVETATGPALDRVAFDRYGLTRFPATPARIDLTLTRPAPGVGGTYPAGSRVQTTDGTQFQVDTDVVFAPADTTKSVTGTALVSGPDGNVAAFAVAQLADAPFDSSLTVFNLTGAAGGAEAESDQAFRGRIRDFFPTVRRAVLGAIEFGALEVAGVAVARAIEINNPNSGFPAAFVQLIIADQAGQSTGALETLVANSLIDFRALGIPVEVLGGQLLTPGPTIQWRGAFETGVDQAVVAAQVRAVTVAVGSTLGPGETLFRSALLAAGRTVAGFIVSDTSLVAPIGDTVPTSVNLVIRIAPESVLFV